MSCLGRTTTVIRANLSLYLPLMLRHTPKSVKGVIRHGKLTTGSIGDQSIKCPKSRNLNEIPTKWMASVHDSLPADSYVTHISFFFLVFFTPYSRIFYIYDVGVNYGRRKPASARGKLTDIHGLLQTFPIQAGELEAFAGIEIKAATFVRNSTAS